MTYYYRAVAVNENSRVNANIPPILEVHGPSGYGNDARPVVYGASEAFANVTIDTSVGPVQVMADENGLCLDDGERHFDFTTLNEADVLIEASISLRIDTTPPVLSASEEDAVVTGSTEEGALVTIYVDGQEVGQVLAEGNDFRFDLSDLGPGRYDVRITAEDEAGNVSVVELVLEIPVPEVPEMVVPNPPIDEELEAIPPELEDESDLRFGYVSGGAACSATDTQEGSMLMLLMALGLALVRRRRVQGRSAAP